MTDSTRVAISAPYPEGALNAITQAAVRAGALESRFMPDRRISRTVARVTPNPRLSARIGRGASLDLGDREVLPFMDPIRLAARASGSPDVFVHTLDWLKSRFDRAVARSLEPRSIGALIGLPGAVEQSFRVVGRDVLRVFHAVDAHPSHHNESLLTHFSRSEVKAELISSRTSDRIERELQLADMVLVPSQVTARGMAAHGVATSKFRQIYFGVNPAQFGQFDNADLSIDAGARVRAIYVGQISRRKGIPHLLEAIRGLRNVELTIVGPSWGAYSLPNLPSNVRYLGVVPHQELDELMAAADVFVFPSIEDACALSLIEASCSGLPVISTRECGSSELLRLPEDRIISAGDIAALRDALASAEPLSRSKRGENRETTHLRMSNPSDPLSDWVEYGDKVLDAVRSGPKEN